MHNNDAILNTFKRLGAVQTGHFMLTSGNHSDTYVQCARILENPRINARLCKKLAQPWMKSRVDIVAGPAVGGIIGAYELARALKARAIYLERVDNKLVLRRGFTINNGENVLVIEDVVTTGGSAQEVVEVIKENKGKVVGVVSLVDRSGKAESPFNVKFNALLKVNPPIYKPEECPLCKKGIPVAKPGSRGLK
ncbi:MAG: orotate phosphoribosyltransferase [Planctomycetes bacterium]|nr:orotate phosphoribosyltransferase [Planctomycetota bacterium]